MTLPARTNVEVSRLQRIIEWLIDDVPDHTVKERLMREYGVSKSTALRDVRKAWEHLAAVDKRTLPMRRSAARARAMRLGRWAFEKARTSTEGVPSAMWGALAMKAEERIARLDGLDKPTKIDVELRGSFVLGNVDVRTLDDASLDALEVALAKVAEVAAAQQRPALPEKVDDEDAEDVEWTEAKTDTAA